MFTHSSFINTEWINHIRALAKDFISFKNNQLLAENKRQ